MKKIIALTAALLLGLAHSAHAESGFSFKDVPNDHLDILLDGKLVARYMDGFDNSTKDRHTETNKPFLHIFDAEGKAPITNGYDPKDQYPHHRGIFIGYKKISFAGKTFERWGMEDNNGPIDPKTKKPGKSTSEIVHLKFAEQKAAANSATITSITAWNDEAGKPFINEERTMTFHRAPAPARVIVDFTSKLTPVGDCVLDGDPEHGGVQYRPAFGIDMAKTLYVIPAENPDAHKDLDYPWVGETYSLRDHLYSVVQMSHPSDPKGTRWSAYRNYGRFGAFIKRELKAGESTTLKYRFLIADGEMPSASFIEEIYDEYTGAKTPAPKVTVMPAEQPKPKAEPKK